MKRLVSGLICALVVMLTSAARSSAQAEDPDALVVVLGDRLGWLDVPALAARLDALAHVVVQAAPTERSSELSIHMRGADRARVVLTRPDGRTLGRTVRLPSDTAERLETIAILTANLLRDESRELLAMLRPSPDAPSDSVTETPAQPATEEPAQPATETPAQPAEPATEAPAQPSTEAPATEAPATEAPSTEAPAATDAMLDAPPSPRPAFLRIGLSGELGSVPRGTGYEVDALYGVELSWTAPELLAIGLRDVGVNGLPEGREGISIDFAPFVELGGRFEFLTLYGQIGVHTQVVVDFGVNEYVGVAPLAAVGVRFRVIPEMSIGLETLVRVVASERFTTDLHSLPQLSVPWMGGLALLFHVS